VILIGNAFDHLKTLSSNSVDCVVTSPPYYGLRDYGMGEQIGLEQTPEEFVIKMKALFRHVRRVLRPNGTLWLNLGDSYWGGKMDATSKQLSNLNTNQRNTQRSHSTLKQKDLIGIPWRVALALQQDGWYLRSDIIWHKPNPMPESVRDRPTKSHEYIFLLTKTDDYYYDSDAILEPFSEDRGGITKARGATAYCVARGNDQSNSGGFTRSRDGRNKRSVWTVTTGSFKGAHFATFPKKLIEPCILAGCPKGGTVLDPFFGSGTTGLVAEELGRKYIGIELNPKFAAIAQERLGVKRRTFTRTYHSKRTRDGGSEKKDIPTPRREVGDFSEEISELRSGRGVGALLY